MPSPRVIRRLVAAWALGTVIALMNVAVAFADGGGGPYPKF